mgnify:CR=1 FL=1
MPSINGKDPNRPAARRTPPALSPANVAGQDGRTDQMCASLTVVIPIELDYRVTPNSREDWRTKHAIQRDMKATTHYTMREAIDHTDPVACFQTARWPLTLHYVIGLAKGRRRMDDINAIAGLKYIEDGIAAALGIDDKHFRFGTIDQVRDPEQRGYVRVTICEEGAGA